jgi:hypothetical protein
MYCGARIKRRVTDGHSTGFHVMQSKSVLVTDACAAAVLRAFCSASQRGRSTSWSALPGIV